MIDRGTGAILCLLLVAACAPVQEEPVPIRIQPGVHDIALLVPEGWQHLDHGQEHRFHKNQSQISVADIGPVTREGYLREIKHALGLFRRQQAEDAKAHMEMLPLRSHLLSEREWDEISGAWYVAVDGGLKRNTTPDDVEVAYDTLLQQVAARKTRTFAELVEHVLVMVFSAPHREVAEQTPILIDGRQGMRLQTWDRLSHDHRQSYLFVLNEDNMLVLRMELGDFAAMLPAFESVLDSLEIHPRPEIAP